MVSSRPAKPGLVQAWMGQRPGLWRPGLCRPSPVQAWPCPGLASSRPGLFSAQMAPNGCTGVGNLLHMATLWPCGPLGPLEPPWAPLVACLGPFFLPLQGGKDKVYTKETLYEQKGTNCTNINSYFGRYFYHASGYRAYEKNYIEGKTCTHRIQSSSR